MRHREGGTPPPPRELVTDENKRKLTGPGRESRYENAERDARLNREFVDMANRADVDLTPLEGDVPKNLVTDTSPRNLKGPGREDVSVVAKGRANKEKGLAFLAQAQNAGVTKEELDPTFGETFTEDTRPRSLKGSGRTDGLTANEKSLANLEFVQRARELGLSADLDPTKHDTTEYVVEKASRSSIPTREYDVNSANEIHAKIEAARARQAEAKAEAAKTRKARETFFKQQPEVEGEVPVVEDEFTSNEHVQLGGERIDTTAIAEQLKAQQDAHKRLLLDQQKRANARSIARAERLAQRNDEEAAG